MKLGNEHSANFDIHQSSDIGTRYKLYNFREVILEINKQLSLTVVCMWIARNKCGSLIYLYFVTNKCMCVSIYFLIKLKLNSPNSKNLKINTVYNNILLYYLMTVSLE